MKIPGVILRSSFIVAIFYILGCHKSSISDELLFYPISNTVYSEGTTFISSTAQCVRISPISQDWQMAIKDLSEENINTNTTFRTKALPASVGTVYLVEKINNKPIAKIYRVYAGGDIVTAYKTTTSDNNGISFSNSKMIWTQSSKWVCDRTIEILRKKMPGALEFFDQMERIKNGSYTFGE